MPTHGIFTVDTLSPALGDLKLTADEAAELEGVMAPSVYNAVLQRALDARGCAFVSMGGDPGKIELLRTADAGVAPRSRKAATPPPATEAARRAHPERQRQIGYTRKQRDAEIAPGVHRGAYAAEAKAWRRAARPSKHELVLEAMAVAGSATASSSTAFRAFATVRRRAREVLRPIYEPLLRRHLRWKQFIEKQRSLDTLVQRFKAIERTRGKQLILAYGAWGLRAGTQGDPISKGCLGVGLLRYLARFFVVCVVPEHHTSKTCFHCGGEATNHPKIAEQRRPARDTALRGKLQRRLSELTAQGYATTDVRVVQAHKWHERALARPPEVRGLRYCAHGCKRCLNRDYNAACNIHVNFQRLLFGLGPIRTLTAGEAALQDADAALCPSSE